MEVEDEDSTTGVCELMQIEFVGAIVKAVQPAKNALVEGVSICIELATEELLTYSMESDVEGLTAATDVVLGTRDKKVVVEKDCTMLSLNIKLIVATEEVDCDCKQGKLGVRSNIDVDTGKPKVNVTSEGMGSAVEESDADAGVGTAVIETNIE